MNPTNDEAMVCGILARSDLVAWTQAELLWAAEVCPRKPDDNDATWIARVREEITRKTVAIDKP